MNRPKDGVLTALESLIAERGAVYLVLLDPDRLDAERNASLAA